MREPIIFIVDDEELSNKFTSRYLKLKGYKNCHSFYSGAECLANLFLKPDIIFLDQHMDNISGLDVLKHVKDAEPNIKVVMLSSNSKPSFINETLNNGLFDYVIKDQNELMFIENSLNTFHQVSPNLIQPKKVSGF